MYAERHGWQTELLNVNETELGGYKEISFVISGDGAYSRLKYETAYIAYSACQKQGPRPRTHVNGNCGRIAGSGRRGD